MDTITLVEQVMLSIKQRIAGRTLAPGAKLPSIRGYAETMQVSKSTVVEAYDRLSAEGVILSRRGSGFFVAGQIAPLSLAEIGPKLDRAVDPLWVSRQSLEAGDDYLKPGCGWMPPSWMPETTIRKALRTMSRANDTILTEYSSPLGLSEFRQFLARRAGTYGIEASPDQVILTGSGTQAIDQLCRFLLEPGDCVVVDDPCYFNFHALLRAHRAKVISVPFTPSGPDIAAFEQTLLEHQPKLYITNSGLHNPTGATLSPVTAHRVLKLAEQYNLTIIEDDIFADLEPDHAPRYAAFDGLDRVVHIGSFSKTLSASVRCGYIIAKQDWIDGLVDLRIATSFGAGHFAAELVLSVLKDGAYRKHLDALKSKLAGVMGQTKTRLANLGIKPWVEPRGGMFLWCELPQGVDGAKLAQLALARDIILAPGSVFSLNNTADRFMRFNAAQAQDPRIYEVLEELLNKESNWR